MEEIGYIVRTLAYNDTGSLVLYLLQAIFLLIPPVLFAASLYMVYSRIVRAVHGESSSLIPPRWTTTIFVVGDFFCLNIQSGGAGLLANPKNAALGNNIIVAGLGLQVLLFAGFMVACRTFHVRFRARLAAAGRTRHDVPWETLLYMLYATSTAILVRNIFRMAEFTTGQDGYLFVNEWTTYVFDGGLMLLVMGGFYAWYPSRLRLDKADRGSAVELAPAVANQQDLGPL